MGAGSGERNELDKFLIIRKSSDDLIQVHTRTITIIYRISHL
jgi:hypothetical protein